MLTDTGSLRSASSLLSRSASLSARPLFLALWLLGGCAQAPGYNEHWDDADSQEMDEDEAPPTSSARSDASRAPEVDRDASDEVDEGAGRRDAAAAEPVRDAAPPAMPPAAEAGARDAATPGDEPPVADASAGDDQMVDSSAPANPPPPKDAAAPRDTGTATPPDAQPAPAACASTPSYLTPDACSQCICARCASQVAVCYASPDQTKNQQCRQIRECAQANQCAGIDCYCGDSALCLTRPTGACVEVIQRVAGTDSTLTIMNASNDSTSPVGRANTLSMCSQSSCATECGF